MNYGDGPDQTSLRDSRGRFRTQSLFFEMHTGGPDTAVYTLKARDHNGLPSARQLYLECGDPTEWQAAYTLLGGWQHWQRLCKVAWFKPYLTEWREALEVKLRSQGIQQIAAIAGGKSPGALQAARWMAERGWEPKKTGRPTKAEKEAELKKQAMIDDEVDEDLSRISIH